MKAILKFNLPEEKEEYDLTMKGCDLHCLLFAFNQKLRQIVKYDESISEEKREAYEHARELLFDLAEEHECEMYI